MHKALRVLAIIAVVTALIEVFALLVEILSPKEAPTEYSLIYAQSARLRWMIYVTSGLLFLIIGVFTRKKMVLLGNSFAIGGVYLMLLGNNGGIWSVGHESWRLITSIATLIILCFITHRLDHEGTGKGGDQSWNKSREENSALGSPGHSQA